MRIVVCVKQVPASNEVKIDPVTGRLIREGVEAVMNPFDLYAVEQGVLLREEHGGETIALSMGPRQAEQTLRECLALGCQRAVLLSDSAFAGSDTWATSYALSLAIRKIGDVDLVICGKQAIDGDTAQVGPGIAAHLDWPQVTYVSHLRALENGDLTVTRMNEDGYDVAQLTLPAVISVVKDINTPRVPNLRSVLASRKAAIERWDDVTIEADVARIGLNGSPTRVVKTAPPPPRGGQSMRIEGNPGQCASRIVHELRKRSIV